jgi:hypothetical protein
MNASFRPRRCSVSPGGFLALVGCLSLAAGAALAASAPPGDVARLLACRGIAADTARLQCFDRAATILAQATSPGASSRDAAALDPRRTFGMSPSAILAREIKSGIRRKEISSIAARIASLGTAPDGRRIYALDDGQVWEELVANGDAPPVNRGETVQISRGWLDSYWMQTPSGRGCKVQRLR